MTIFLRALTVTAMLAAVPVAHAANTAGTTAAGTATSAKTADKKTGGVKGIKLNQTGGVSELTEQECTRLGGVVTTGVPNDSTCSTNTRCKTTLANGDIRSICVDEVSP